MNSNITDRVLYVLIGFAVISAFTGCKEESTAASTAPVTTPAVTTPVAPATQPTNNTQPSTPVEEMAYVVSWDTTYNHENVSVALSANANLNGNFKRIDIYSDSACQNLESVVTPSALVQQAATWTIQRGVVSYVSVIETDNDDLSSGCKQLASTQADNDVTPPSAPTGIQVSYQWASADTLSVAAQWTASTDNVSVTGYNIYLSNDPNGFGNALVAVSSTGTQKSFTYQVDPSMLAGSNVYVHIVAVDQDNNMSTSVSDAGFYMDTVSPVLAPNVAYLNRGSTGLLLSLSGTCEAGIPVTFDYSNMDSFKSLLPTTVSCDNGSFNVSFPILYTWYDINMSVIMTQIDANNNRTDYVQNLEDPQNLSSVLQ